MQKMYVFLRKKNYRIGGSSQNIARLLSVPVGIIHEAARKAYRHHDFVEISRHVSKRLAGQRRSVLRQQSAFQSNVSTLGA
jgi:hypothetical protein